MSNKALDRKIYKYAGSFLGVLLVFFIGMVINKSLYERKLLKEGIRTEVQVINKYHFKNIKGKIKKSFIEIAIFEDTSVVNRQEQKEVKEEPANINDKIDALFDNISANRKPAGNYKTIKLQTDLKNFGATNTGSWKTFVYLKGEVEKGMLLDVLE